MKRKDGKWRDNRAHTSPITFYTQGFSKFLTSSKAFPKTRINLNQYDQNFRINFKLRLDYDFIGSQIPF